jgi:hypothetical protein
LSGASTEQLSVKGRLIAIPAINSGAFTIALIGKFLRIGVIRDESWQSDPVTGPHEILKVLRQARPRPDIFTFSQRLPDTEPHFDFHVEYDNVAAVPVSSYEDWLKKQIKPDARNKVRKSQKSGVVTEVVEFDDNLVDGITRIYNETPVRQGKKFWHFGKDAETVRQENSTYLNRSEFIGAYYDGRLIGFLKMVYVGSYAEVMQILSLVSERDRAPTNALIAKAVETCAQKGLSHFVYANFSYGAKGDDSLTEFKRRNGFVKIDLPRYYVPITLRGRVALALGLHRGIRELLPRRLLLVLIGLRGRWQKLRARRAA